MWVCAEFYYWPFNMKILTFNSGIFSFLDLFQWWLLCSVFLSSLSRISVIKIFEFLDWSSHNLVVFPPILYHFVFLFYFEIFPLLYLPSSPLAFLLLLSYFNFQECFSECTFFFFNMTFLFLGGCNYFHHTENIKDGFFCFKVFSSFRIYVFLNCFCLFAYLGPYMYYRFS